MITEFEHKYKVGDVVWIMGHGIPTKTRVQRIKATFTLPMYGQIITNPSTARKVQFELTYSVGDSVIRLGGLHESELFATKEELLSAYDKDNNEH